jgi:hypothetical protein
MAELRGLHHNLAGIEDVLLSEQIEPPGPLRELLIKEGVVARPPSQSRDLEVPRYSQLSQKAVQLLLLNRFALNSRPNPVERL